MKNIYEYSIWFDLPLWFIDSLALNNEERVQMQSEIANGYYCQDCINSEFERVKNKDYANMGKAYILCQIKPKQEVIYESLRCFEHCYCFICDKCKKSFIGWEELAIGLEDYKKNYCYWHYLGDKNNCEACKLENKYCVPF